MLEYAGGGSRLPGAGKSTRGFANDDAMHLPGNSLSGYGLDDDRRQRTMLALLTMDIRSVRSSTK